MKTLFTSLLSVCVLCALGSCVERAAEPAAAPEAPPVARQASALVMEAGWVAGSGWPSETAVALQNAFLGAGSRVQGPLAVVTSHAGPYLQSGSELVLGLNAEVDGSVVADSLEIGLGAQILGDATYNELPLNNGSILGTVTQGVGSPLPISVPTYADFSAGSTMVDVTGGTAQTLSPGAYDRVIVRAGTAINKTVVTLSGGDYYLRVLDVRAHGRVECSAACRIFIKERLWPGASTYIGPSGASGLTVDAVEVVVEGVNAAGGDPNDLPHAAAIGLSSELKAFIFVPNGTLMLRSGSLAIGKIVARDIELGVGALVYDSDGYVPPDGWMMGNQWPADSVVALNSLQMRIGAVLQGHAAVIRVAEGLVLADAAEASIGLNSQVQGDLRADTIHIAWGAVVQGTARYNQRTGLGSVAGSEVTPLALPLPITVPTLPPITPDTALIDVPPNADWTLDAGAYGNVILRDGAASDNTVLTLTGGVYHFNNLDLRGDAQLLCSAPCEVRVKQRIAPGLRVTVGPAAGSGLHAGDVRIFVEGINGGLGGPAALPRAAAFGLNNTLAAWLFVPNGSLELRQNSVATGRLVAHDVLLLGSTTVQGPPHITTDPEPTQLAYGEDLSLYCEASSSLSVSYRWEKDGVLLSDGGDVSGATTQTLMVADVGLDDEGAYLCVATSAAGATSSADAQVDVILPPPVVGEHPVDLTVVAGDSADFECAATGVAIDFLWQRNGVDLVEGPDTVGVATPLLTLLDVDLADRGQYRCAVDNGDHTVHSEEATLEVIAEIDSCAELQAMRDALDAHYRLVADIDCTGFDSGDGLGFEPVGDLDQGWNPFWGIFEGQGHVITGLHMTRGGARGLFGGTKDAIISRVGIEDIDYEYESGYAGALVGYAIDSVISESYATGVIESDDYVGGIAAIVDGSQLTDVYSRVEVISYDDSGLLVRYVGPEALVQRAYAAAPSLAPAMLAAQYTPGTVVDSYFDCDVAGNCGAFGARTAEALWTEATFAGAGFDFTGVWGWLDAPDYPCLRWQSGCAAVSAPVIDPDPASVVAELEQNASFSCNATGRALRYQWQRDSLDLADGGNVAGATSSQLVLSSVTQGDGGIYRCVVTNPAGSVTSAGASLTVSEPPVITQGPQSQPVDELGSVQFECVASGPDLTFAWRKGTDLLTGETASTLVIDDARLQDEGEYFCLVSNAFGSDESDPATLTVNLAPPQFTTVPADRQEPEHGTAVFTCEADGTDVTYGWQRGPGGQDLPGETGTTLGLPDVGLEEEGTYRCVASNRDHTVYSEYVTLTVLLAAPEITQPPQDANPTEGQSVQLTCQAQATGSLTYQWFKGVAPVADAGHISGALTPLLSFSPVSSDDTGEYHCVVTGRDASAQSDPASLTVQLLPPEITQDPVTQNVTEGDNATFACAASGTDVTVRWQKNQADLPGALGGTLELTGVALSDAGAYRCVAQNSGGSEASAEAQLVVTPLAPSITQHPEDQSVPEGGEVTFSCAASGDGVGYRWQKDEQDIAGAAESSYTLAEVTAADAGEYHCIATNAHGAAASDPATLTVTAAPPAITEHPQSQDVVLYAAFTLGVTASGGNLTYQWYRNGTPIVGATGASYTKAQASESDDDASFTVTVSNSADSVTSNAATITITGADAPRLTVDNAPEITLTEDSIVITGTATDQGNAPLTATVTNSQHPGQDFGVVFNPDGSFEGEIPLELGDNVLTVTVTDENGNQSTATITVTVTASEVPRLAITEPAGGSFVDAGHTTVRGTVRSSLEPEQVRLLLGQRVAFPKGVEGEEYTFEFANVPLITGANLISVVAETVHGNASASIVVHRGTPPPPPPSQSPPVISLAVDSPHVYLTTDTFLVSGTVTADTCIQSVTVNDLPANVAGEGNAVSFDHQLDFDILGEDVAVRVEATDCNGLQTEVSYTAHRDNTGPVIALDGLQLEGAVNAITTSPYQLTGTITDPRLAGVRVGEQSVGALPAGTDSWTLAVDLQLPREVETSLEIEAWDSAGNRTTENVVLLLDTPLEVEIISPPEGSRLLASGASAEMEVVATIEGLAGGEQFTAVVDAGTPVPLAVTGRYASGEVTFSASSGVHEVVVIVADGGGVELTRASRRFEIQAVDDVPLQVVRQRPAADARDVEANSFVTLHFSRPVDPSLLTLSVTETVHGRIYEGDRPAADLTTASATVRTVEVHREQEPVPGGAQNFPGNTMIAFYPSRDFGYGGTVFVEVEYEGQPLWRSRFHVRPLPTLVQGFVSDHRKRPLPGITVELPELGRTVTTDAEGSYTFGYGEAADAMLPAGRHRMLINGGRGDGRHGTIERFLDVRTGERHYAGVASVPVLHPGEAFRHLESGQTDIAILAGGDVLLDLSDAELSFPGGLPSGGVQTQLLDLRELSYGSLPSVVPSWAYVSQPGPIELGGEVAATLALPLLDGSHDYVQELPEYAVLLGLDPASLLLQPVGVARIDKDNRQLVSEGVLHLQRLDYLSAALGPEGSQALYGQYVAGELSLPQLIAALEGRQP